MENEDEGGLTNNIGGGGGGGEGGGEWRRGWIDKQYAEEFQLVCLSPSLSKKHNIFSPESELEHTALLF